MALAPKIMLILAGLAVVGTGVVLWVQYGGLIFFDMLAASFLGCLI